MEGVISRQSGPGPAFCRGWRQ